MGYDSKINQYLDLEEFTPAVGQGSIAIEVHEQIASEKKELVRFAVNHPSSEKCLLAERAYLKKLEGGCSIPVFGLASLEGPNIHMQAGIVSLDGKQRIVKKLTDSASDPQAIGTLMADLVMQAGGDKILTEIKAELNK
jgi:hydroxymethylbilane synthase